MKEEVDIEFAFASIPRLYFKKVCSWKQYLYKNNNNNNRRALVILKVLKRVHCLWAFKETTIQVSWGLNTGIRFCKEHSSVNIKPDDDGLFLCELFNHNINSI